VNYPKGIVRSGIAIDHLDEIREGRFFSAMGDAFPRQTLQDGTLFRINNQSRFFAVEKVDIEIQFIVTKTHRLQVLNAWRHGAIDEIVEKETDALDVEIADYDTMGAVFTRRKISTAIVFPVPGRRQ